MRGMVGALLVIVALAAPAVAVPDEPKDWTLWAEDPKENLVALPGDLESVQVATTPVHLHVALDTYDSIVEPPVLAWSQADFVADQDGPTQVRFAWDKAPRLWIGNEEVDDGWQVSADSGPGGWHLQVAWAQLGISPGRAFALRDLKAMAATAEIVDEGTGPDLEFTPGPSGTLSVSVVTLSDGATVEGPDYAGGASVTVDARGEPLIAYYIYDGERGPERGIYLARIGALTDAGLVGGQASGFVSERIADTRISRDNGRDAQMRTQVAHDGTETFVLFTDDPAVDNDEDGVGHLGTPDSVFVLASGNGWQREDPTPGGKSDVGAEDVSDLAAREGKVVAAVPVGSDVWVVERTGAGAWKELARLPSATNAKLAIDSAGTVHAAYAVYGTAEGSWRDGTLHYASSKDGFKPVHVGDNIDSGWEEPETDGSFAIAVGPEDQVALLWNDGRADREEEQKLAILEGQDWTYDVAPLVPGHGNPQYTMRLGFTGKGHLVAASGYGGTDTLAVRGPNGGWVTKELDRYDVWDMAVSNSGSVYFAYTQPHGGTTVAVTAFSVSPLLGPVGAASGPADEAHSVRADASRPRFLPSASVAAATAMLALAALARSRRVL